MKPGGMKLRYCFGPAKSAVVGFSRISCSRQVTGWLASFYGRTSSRTVPAYLYLPCRNVSRYCVKKMSATAKISLIFAKLQQSISLLTGVLSKNGKSKRRSSNCTNWGVERGGLSAVPIPHALINS